MTASSSVYTPSPSGLRLIFKRREPTTRYLLLHRLLAGHPVVHQQAVTEHQQRAVRHREGAEHQQQHLHQRQLQAGALHLLLAV